MHLPIRDLVSLTRMLRRADRRHEAAQCEALLAHKCGPLFAAALIDGRIQCH